jgi:hypothetical protein
LLAERERPLDRVALLRFSKRGAVAAGVEDVLARTGNAKVRTVASRLALGRRAGANLAGIDRSETRGMDDKRRRRQTAAVASLWRCKFAAAWFPW